MPDVQIDYGTVSALAQEFALASETLLALMQAVDGDIDLLNTSAFTGLVGKFALDFDLGAIGPQFEALASHCQLLADDLNAAINALQRGDTSGSARFAR
jgi:hypothetical protein